MSAAAMELREVALARPGTFELLKMLEREGKITPVSLELPPDLSYNKIEALFAFFGAVKRRTSFYLGDLILYSEGTLGEKYAQAAEATGLSPQTLQNCAYVCRQIPPGENSRRRPNVPFSVHAEVAPLKARAQEKWLRKAEEEGWSQRELRAALRDAKAKDPVEEPLWTPEPDQDRVMKLAATLSRRAENLGDGRYAVEAELIVQLRVALGEQTEE